ncbi:hypothetical protein ACFSC4_04055 [Deinococcus malanensis]|nr:hypothetical protein [Deinococcus malanensis]
MIILQGTYKVAPTKRLTILAEPGNQDKGTLAADIDALTHGCALGGGKCNITVTTQHGQMTGTLYEKKPRKLSLWQFEGHLSFPQRD